MSFARIRALAVVGALVIAAAITVTVTIVKDRQDGSITATGGCAAGEVPANPKLPEPKDVKINVFNATDKAGLASVVAADFKNRKFKVVKDPTNDPLNKRVEGVAVLRYGPKMVGAAWLLRAYFLNQAQTELDLKRTDDVVDIVIGLQFRQLATVTETNQALARLGSPTLPNGTCAGNS